MKVTGKQLTVMVAAVCAATILTPAAVSAATGSSVNITDPVTSSSKARVAGGKLYVGDGSGAMTVDGLVRVSDGSGPLTVDGTVKVGDGSGALTVDGTVVSADAASSWSKSGEITANGSDMVLIGDLAPNAGITLGSITASQTAGTGATQLWLRAIHPNTPGDCTSGTSQADVAQYSVPQDDTRTITYSPRFKVPKQASESCLFLFVGGGGTHTLSVSVTGGTW